MHGGIQTKVTVHKEEKPGHVKSDRAGCKNRHAKLERCIDPLVSRSDPTDMANISSGAVNKDPLVNCENSQLFGCQQLTMFIDVLPERFEISITRKVAIPQKDKKAVGIGDGLNHVPNQFAAKKIQKKL